MNFLGILRKVGGIALQIEHIAQPIVTTFVPGAGPAFAIANKLEALVPHTLNDVISQEELNPDGPGAPKLQAVQSSFELALFDNLLAPVLAARGETVTYDHAALAEGISAFVTALNAMAKVKASIQIVKLPASSPQTP